MKRLGKVFLPDCHKLSVLFNHSYLAIYIEGLQERFSRPELRRFQAMNLRNLSFEKKNRHFFLIPRSGGGD